MLEFTVDLQLHAAHGEQEKPCFRPPRSGEIADAELPSPDPRRFRPRQRIFYAFVIHEESPAIRLAQRSWVGKVPLSAGEPYGGIHLNANARFNVSSGVIAGAGSESGTVT